VKPLNFLHAAGSWLGRTCSRDAELADERFAAFERLVDVALETRPQAVIFAGGLVDAAGLEAAEFERLSAALGRLRLAELPFVLTPSRSECLTAPATLLSLLAARGLATILVPHPDGRLEPAGAGVSGAYVDLGAQLRVVGLGASAAAERADLMARAALVAASDRFNVLVLTGADAQATGERDVFSYVALGGADEGLASVAGVRDPGPLADAAAGAVPGFLQVTLKTSGATTRSWPSGAAALEVVVLDVTGLASLDELTVRLKRKGARAGALRRVLLKLTGTPGLDLDAESRLAVTQAASRALAGARVDLDLATSYTSASLSLAAGAERAALEGAALAALVARGGAGDAALAELAMSCLGPFLNRGADALDDAAARIAAFEEGRRAG